MEELREDKVITYVEIEEYLNKVFLPEWSKWVFREEGKPGLKVLDVNTHNYRDEEPSITVGVEFYPDGSNEGYRKVIFGIAMGIKVVLNREGKAIKIIEEEGKINGVLNNIIVRGTRYKEIFNGEEHKYTREQDKIVTGRRKDDKHSFTTTNGSCIILLATRNLISKNYQNIKEREAYKEHNIKKVESKEDMLRLERLYNILRADKTYQVSIEGDNLKGRYISVSSSVFKMQLDISPNFIVEKTSTENNVYYSKYGTTSNDLKEARKIIAKKSGYTMKDVRANMYIDKFFRNYVIANDLRRKVKIGK